MAPKKDKSKVEEEAIANMSTGWRKSKMSEAAVQELENLGLLQTQGVIQWRAGEGEYYPMEGTLETVVFRDFMERGLALPVSEFFYALLQFSGIQLHHLTPQSILHLVTRICACDKKIAKLENSCDDMLSKNVDLSSSLACLKSENEMLKSSAVRPGAAGLLIGIECSRVRGSSWMYLTSLVKLPEQE